MEPSFDNLPLAVSELSVKIDQILNRLNDLKGVGSETENDFLTLEQAANFLGLKMSTLYTKTCRHEIPIYKKGKKIWISKQELQKYLKSGRIASSDEVKSKAKEVIAKMKGKPPSIR